MHITCALDVLALRAYSIIHSALQLGKWCRMSFYLDSIRFVYLNQHRRQQCNEEYIYYVIMDYKKKTM